jgi:hypothetical protein
MISVLKETENKSADEPIVMADECGDNMWDDVSKQEVKACEPKVASKHATSPLNSIDAVAVSSSSTGRSQTTQDH